MTTILAYIFTLIFSVFVIFMVVLTITVELKKLVTCMDMKF